MVGIVLLGVFVLLLAFGAPIAVCLGMSSVGAILVQGAGKPLDAIMSVLPRLCSSASSKFVLLAIPFFILSGNVMEKAGISGRLINLAEKCLGHIRGGMAMVCVVVSCFFAAISGSGPATVAALGLIMIPALKKAGYSPAFACALMAAGGAIGVVIPPSITFVVYGSIADASITDLFKAGVIPGLLMGLGLIVAALFVGRKAYAPVIESIKKNGILLDECAPGSGTGETVSFRPAMATTDPKEIGVVDLLIVFVHYQYLEAAVRNALPMIDRHTMILCLQNGLGNYDEIAKVVPEEQIIIGNTAFGATPVEPGHVKHTGTGVTNMGSLKAPKENVERMAEALREAGLEVCVHENVMNAIWHKLLANVAINGMSALLETKNGFVDGNQYAHEAARMLVEEAITVANACGCTLDHDAELEHAYEVSRMTDETISSMVQDVTHHRETEIRIITGAVCRLGREHGIATPCNDLMLQLVLAKQSIYLGR